MSPGASAFWVGRPSEMAQSMRPCRGQPLGLRPSMAIGSTPSPCLASALLVFVILCAGALAGAPAGAIDSDLDMRLRCLGTSSVVPPLTSGGGLAGLPRWRASRCTLLCHRRGRLLPVHGHTASQAPEMLAVDGRETHGNPFRQSGQPIPSGWLGRHSVWATGRGITGVTWRGATSMMSQGRASQ